MIECNWELLRLHNVSYRCPNLTAGQDGCCLPLWFFCSSRGRWTLVRAPSVNKCASPNAVSAMVSQQVTFVSFPNSPCVHCAGDQWLVSGALQSARQHVWNPHRRGKAKGYFSHPYVGKGHKSLSQVDSGHGLMTPMWRGRFYEGACCFGIQASIFPSKFT